MILEVTPNSSFRTAWTSIDPIHWRDPTKEDCLSPTFTKAWREMSHIKTAVFERSTNNTKQWFLCSVLYLQGHYLLDVLVSGYRPLYVALLLKPGADGLEGAVSAAPAIVIHTVLHVVVITVDPLDQVHLKNTKRQIKFKISWTVCFITYLKKRRQTLMSLKRYNT